MNVKTKSVVVGGLVGWFVAARVYAFVLSAVGK